MHYALYLMNKSINQCIYMYHICIVIFVFCIVVLPVMTVFPNIPYVHMYIDKISLVHMVSR